MTLRYVTGAVHPTTAATIYSYLLARVRLGCHGVELQRSLGTEAF